MLEKQLVGFGGKKKKKKKKKKNISKGLTDAHASNTEPSLGSLELRKDGSDLPRSGASQGMA